MSSKKYFSKLNYTLANEDSRLEYEMVLALKPKRTLVVCGSGGRSLPLIAGTQKEIVLSDLAEQQLLLAKHRVATIQQFSWQDFLLYWGFPPFDDRENCERRKVLFDGLKLDENVREFFKDLYEDPEAMPTPYSGLLYLGKWEQTFTGVAKFLRKFIGGKYDEIFDFKTLEEQKAYFDEKLESTRWRFIPRMVLRVFGNAAFFNAFLYKGHFAKKNIEESYFEFYRKVYRSLFYQGLTRENFFLQLTFLGRLQYPEGNTIEAEEEVFNGMKAALKNVPVKCCKEDLISLGEKDPEKFDFVSLSDVPSYFSGDHEKNYLQRLSKGLNPGALVVVRCYLRIPENVNLSGFVDVTSKYADQIAAEKTQMYRIFVYEYRGKS